MKSKLLISLAFICAIAFSSCSKSKDDGPGNPDNGLPPNVGSGIIYFEWADEGILKFNLASSGVSTTWQDDLSRNGWDISLDGAKYLEAKDKSGDGYDKEIFTLINLSNGNVITQFEKESGYANHSFPKLSHDTKLIAVPPTLDNGLMILSLQGTVLHHITAFQGQDIDKGNVNWMPDNSVIFSTGKKICRSNPEFTQASVIKELPFAEWNDLSVSPDGAKMAFAANNHIWMMNADGSNLVQVTTSDEVEAAPEFSPDGKWLVLGTNYHTTGPFGHIWYLVIIPADGKQYNVNKGADKSVIPLIRKGETEPEASSGGLAWR